MSDTPKTNEYLLKLVPIGSSSVINCNFARTLTKNKIKINYSQFYLLGQNIITKRIEYAIQPVKLIVVIPNADVFFDKLRVQYYRGVSAGYIYFHKAYRKTFEEVPALLKEFKKVIPTDIPYTLVGYLAQSEEVTTQEGEQLADQLNVPYYEFDLEDQISTLNVVRYLVNKALQED